MNRLEVHGVYAGYTGTDVLRGVSLSVGQSQCVGLLGPNGAGKSTLLRVMTGQLRPHTGTLTVDDRDATRWRAHRISRAGVRWVGDPRPVFPSLTVAENLAIGGITRRSSYDEESERVYELMPMLRDKRRAHASELSGGQQQMLAIGQALMSRPRYLCLDEPSLGLSPSAVEAMTELIGDLVAHGVGILWAEQFPEVVLGRCSWVVVLSAGTIMHAGPSSQATRDNLRSAYLGARSYEDDRTVP